MGRAIWMVTACLVGGTILPAGSAEPSLLDLAAVMELAGANNDQIALAKLRHEESLALEQLAWQRFWPSFSLGAGYRGHNGRLQDIAGLVFDANKRQYTMGAEVLLDWAPGDHYFAALAARQSALAEAAQAESVRRRIVLQAVDRYFVLLAAEADLAVIEEDLRLTQEYARQLDGAVAAGTAFRADSLRVRTQESRMKARIREGQEARDLAAAALAETLRLPPDVALRPAKADLLPVRLVEDPGDVVPLLAEAGANRPEARAASNAVAASDLEVDRSRLGPLVPNVRSAYASGALGGGPTSQGGNFGDNEDFSVGVAWRIGPGGLFDRQRRVLAETRREAAERESGLVAAAIGREVVEAAAKAASARDRMAIQEEAVAAAEDMVTLASQRQATQVGVVLEYLLAREELTRARQDRIRAVADYNRAQHAWSFALGR